MNQQIMQAVREYQEVKRTKALLPTVDQIAEKHGLSRQNLLYYVQMSGRKAVKKKASSDDAQEA